jgi:methionyl-tRNA formyltransferase
MKIIFLGTPEFGAVILKKLAESPYKPFLVVTAPDKPLGRKKILTPPPVKIIARQYNIPVEQPDKIKNLKSKIEKGKPDLIITAAYGQIIPKEILKIPKYGCLNVHPSLLPKHRGPSPIQTAILNGDKKTGATIILMDEKIDHGKIISNFQFPISNKKITYKELNKKLAYLGAELLIETIPKWINRKIQAVKQDESKATYTKIIKKEDGKIDWSEPAEIIERKIRAFDPWPATFTFFKKSDKILRVKILEAEAAEKKIDGKLCFKCGKNYLIIKKLQPAGKKPMTAEEFLKGYYGYHIVF